MITLPEVTLIGIDCVDVKRLQVAFDISTTNVTFGATKLLTSLPTTDIRAILIEPLTTIDAYSQFCLRNLHAYVETPYALLIQHDGFILNAQAWDAEFLMYDYIGAPILIGDWTQEKFGVAADAIGNLLVGNGGFSLRSHKLLALTAELAARGEFDTDGPEDWVQCYINRTLLINQGIKFAPVAVAEAFSFEGRTKDYFQWKESFGFHSLRWTDISLWLSQHPEYQNLIKNQVEIESLG